MPPASDDCHSLWSDTASAPPALPPFSGDHSASVAVVGGGYTGLSAALHLAEAGADVILMEARRIGYGGSGRNVGLVNAGLWMLPDDIVNTAGPAYGERLVATLGASPQLVWSLIDRHDIDCEDVRAGTLQCAHSPAGFRALAARENQWNHRGAPVTLLSADDAAPMIGSTAFHGALLDNRAGILQPLSYVRGLARAADAAGARLFEGAPVTDCRRDGGRWVLRTPGGTVRAEALIIAVHGYPQEAFAGHRAQIIDFNFFQCATPPLTDAVRRTILPGGHGAWDTALVLSSYRLDAGGRLIVGGVGRVDGWVNGYHRRWAARTIRRVFPQVGDVTLTHAWSGRIAMTPNHIPRLHRPAPGALIVTSFNGRGIGPGSLFGKLLAEATLSADTRDLPLPVTTARPVFARGLHNWFYETGARLYHLTQHRRNKM